MRRGGGCLRKTSWTILTGSGLLKHKSETAKTFKRWMSPSKVHSSREPRYKGFRIDSKLLLPCTQTASTVMRR